MNIWRVRAELPIKNIYDNSITHDFYFSRQHQAELMYERYAAMPEFSDVHWQIDEVSVDNVDVVAYELRQMRMVLGRPDPADRRMDPAELTRRVLDAFNI